MPLQEPPPPEAVLPRKPVPLQEPPPPEAEPPRKPLALQEPPPPEAVPKRPARDQAPAGPHASAESKKPTRPMTMHFMIHLLFSGIWMACSALVA